MYSPSVEAIAPLANDSLHGCSPVWWLPCSPQRAAQLGKATIQLATDSLQWAEEQRQRLDERQQQQEQAQLNGWAARDSMGHSEGEVRQLLHQSSRWRGSCAGCLFKQGHPSRAACWTACPRSNAWPQQDEVPASAWWHGSTCLWLLAQCSHGLCLCGIVKTALQDADPSSVLLCI